METPPLCGRTLKLVGILVAIFFLAPPLFPATDRKGVSATILPRETVVLRLPMLDVTKEAANMQAPRQLVVRHREQVELLTRQFKVLGEVMAAKFAKASPAIDLSEPSARTSENLDLLAKRADADWVVHTVVEDVDADTDANGTFAVKTRMLIQVWDVRRGDWLIDRPYTGQASGSGSPVMIFLRSLDLAVQGALATALEGYPRVAAVESENSLVDYLPNQTDPVVVEPGKSFPVPRVQ